MIGFFHGAGLSVLHHAPPALPPIPPSRGSLGYSTVTPAATVSDARRCTRMQLESLVFDAVTVACTGTLTNVTRGGKPGRLGCPSGRCPFQHVPGRTSKAARKLRIGDAMIEGYAGPYEKILGLHESSCSRAFYGLNSRKVVPSMRHINSMNRGS
jgi:hypothetical protein